MPGMAKTFSIRIALPTRPASCRPVTVTTGPAALRRPWRTVACSRVAPVASAVRRKSCSYTSSSDARMNRQRVAPSGSPTASAGSTSPSRLRTGSSVNEVNPMLGQAGATIATTNTRQSPNMNTGADRPRKAQPRTIRSDSRPCRNAATAPAGIPQSTDTRVAASVSSMVLGSRCRISSSTGSPLNTEYPKSPCARLPSHTRYCWTSGRSSPRSTMMPRRVAASE